MFKDNLFFSGSKVQGELPQCIWSLPNLTTLHAAGNGITGRLPEENVPIGKKLKNLNIGHNRISGSISNNLAAVSFKEFDISVNKISGKIHISPADSSDSSTIINTEINRFSGHLDVKTVSSFDSVRVLSGNIIACNSLPDKDPTSKDFECESSNLDIALYYLASVVTFVFMLVALVVFYSTTNKSYVDGYVVGEFLRDISVKMTYWSRLSFDSRFSSKMTHSSIFMNSLNDLCLIGLAFSLVIIPVIVIIYTSFKLNDTDNTFKTHTYEYTYLISSSYLSGLLPALILLLVIPALALT